MKRLMALSGLLLVGACLPMGCSLLTLRPGDGAKPAPSPDDPLSSLGIQAASDLFVILAVVGHRYLYHKKSKICASASPANGAKHGDGT